MGSNGFRTMSVTLKLYVLYLLVCVFFNVLSLKWYHMGRFADNESILSAKITSCILPILSLDC